MRMLLIVLQVVAVALVYIGVSLATGTLAVGFRFGGGPGAAAAGMLLVMHALLLGMLFFTTVLPFFVVLLATLGCAALAGYRFFRWTRWIGLAVNIAAAWYFLFAAGGDKAKPVAIDLRIGVVFFFVCNSVLFLMIPKQPNVQKSRWITAWAHPMLPLCVLLLIGPNFLSRLISHPTAIITYLALLLAYAAPFTLNFRATRTIHSLPGDAKKTILPTIVSLAVMGLGGLVHPILAIPVGISLLIFILFLEMLFLYPDRYPERAWHVYCIKLLGGLPDKPAPLSVSDLPVIFDDSKTT